MMSIEYCEKHNKYWDMDWLEQCPECLDKELGKEDKCICDSRPFHIKVIKDPNCPVHKKELRPLKTERKLLKELSEPVIKLIHTILIKHDSILIEELEKLQKENERLEKMLDDANIITDKKLRHYSSG